MVSIAVASARNLRRFSPDPVRKKVEDEMKPSRPPSLNSDHAALVKIGVEVGAIGGDAVMFLQIGLDRFDIFHPHIGRIADHDIEAAALEHLRKGRAPVERPRP